MDRNKYQKWYEQLIAGTRSRAKPDGYTERHHIVPRSLGGRNNKTNIVVLTAREHFVAHLLLYRIHRKDPEAKAKMLRALVRFAVKTGREFEIARTILAREYTGVGNPSFGKRWGHHPVTGEIVFERAIPEGFVEGLPFQRGGHRDYVWANNGLVETMLPEDELPADWSIGRLNKPDRAQLRAATANRHTAERDAAHAAKLKGRVQVYNPATGNRKRVARAELDDHLARGWTTQSAPTKLSRHCRVGNRTFATLAEAARAHGVSPMTASYRIQSQHPRWTDWRYL